MIIMTDILINQQVEFAILDQLTKVAQAPQKTRDEIANYHRILNYKDAEQHIKNVHSNACHDAERLLEALEEIRGNNG